MCWCNAPYRCDAAVRFDEGTVHGKQLKYLGTEELEALAHVGEQPPQNNEQPLDMGTNPRHTTPTSRIRRETLVRALYGKS